VFQRGAPQHYVIQVNAGTYAIDDGPRKNSLAELINYYRFDPTSPTKLTTPVCRAGASMDAWEAKLSGGSGAPPSIPSRAGRGGNAPMPVAVNMENIYGNIAPEAVVEIPKAAPTPAPLNKKPPPAPSSSGADAPPAHQPDNDTVKNFHKLVDEIEAIEMDERSDDEDDCGDFGDSGQVMRQQFQNEAYLTEQLNCWWLNNMLKRLGKDKTVSNVRESVKDAVLLIQILELLSGQKPPKYFKMARMEVQLRDNWSAIVRYMRDLGIRVDNVKAKYQRTSGKEVDLNEEVEEQLSDPGGFG